jgi:hypothetical protein
LSEALLDFSDVSELSNWLDGHQVWTRIYSIEIFSY